MDRLDELAVFVAVLEAGGLAAAGRKLRRSPAAVTRSLAGLEARLGVRLIERTTRRLAPTEAGRRLADQARRVLADYETAVSAEAAEGPLRGQLTVTAPLVFGRRHVTPVVTRFLAIHPGLTVDLVLNDRNLDMIEEGLDVAVRIGPLADSGLLVRRVGEVRRVVVAAPDYLAREGTPARPRDLAGHQVAQIITRPQAMSDWRFRRPDGREEVVRVTPRLTVSDVDAGLAAVRDGHGIGRALSYQVAEDLAAGRLVRLLRAFEPAALPVQLVALSGRLMPGKVRAFLDHAAAELGRLAVLRGEGVDGVGSGAATPD
jgi:DNA-binding transcriptional LysR family regulator